MTNPDQSSDVGRKVEGMDDCRYSAAGGQWADFDAVAKEAALVDLYRQGTLTRHQLGTALELDRFAVDALLKRHLVMEDLITRDALAFQLAALHNVIKNDRCFGLRCDIVPSLQPHAHAQPIDELGR